MPQSHSDVEERGLNLPIQNAQAGLEDLLSENSATDFWAEDTLELLIRFIKGQRLLAVSTLGSQHTRIWFLKTLGYFYSWNRNPYRGPPPCLRWYAEQLLYVAT